MDLEKFEKWLLSQNLNSKHFIFPADRILFKLGYRGIPLVYRSYTQLTLLFTIYFSTVLPMVIWLFFGLILQDFGWVTPFLGEGTIIVFWALSSVSTGLMASYFIKRTTKKTNLPEWHIKPIY